MTKCERAIQMKQAAAAVYFAKRAGRILGPGEAIESHRALDEALDYEVELAVVLGKGGRDIPPEQAEEHIFGYSVFNDVSARRCRAAMHSGCGARAWMDLR